MLLLNFMFLLVLSDNHLIQIFWTPHWHCLDSFSGSIGTLAVERRLIKHHLAITILMRHIWWKTNEMVRIRWSMHVFMHPHWIISWVIFLSKLLSNPVIFESTSWKTPFSWIIEWTLLFQLLSVNLGVTRYSLFIVFYLPYPIVWRWSGKWAKTLVIRFITLEVLVCELNSSAIWIFSTSNLWIPLCNLLSVLVAYAIVHNGFLLLADSTVGLRRVTLTRFTHTIFSSLRITIITSYQITCPRGSISARLGARNGHHILLTLGLVMRLLHLLLHKAIG